jgi:hypothetical protein
MIGLSLQIHARVMGEGPVVAMKIFIGLLIVVLFLRITTPFLANDRMRQAWASLAEQHLVKELSYRYYS